MQADNILERDPLGNIIQWEADREARIKQMEIKARPYHPIIQNFGEGVCLMCKGTFIKSMTEQLYCDIPKPCRKEATYLKRQEWLAKRKLKEPS